MTPQIPLVGGNYYHIYNRGNNGETIFHTAENYRYFLRLFARNRSDRVHLDGCQ